MRLLVSACLIGVPCGSDGSAYGAPFAHTARLLAQPNVESVVFCPEELAFGTPRAVPDIHGGDGFDVLDGQARVVSASGEDWTEPMLRAAEAMLRLAQREAVHLALLMDISAACGSQVIYLGARSQGIHQQGPGVCSHADTLWLPCDQPTRFQNARSGPAQTRRRIRRGSRCSRSPPVCVVHRALRSLNPLPRGLRIVRRIESGSGTR